MSEEEKQIPPEVQADLFRRAYEAVPTDPHTDIPLDTARRVSRLFRDLGDKAWDLTFTPPVSEEQAQAQDRLFQIVDRCDRVVAATRNQAEQDASLMDLVGDPASDTAAALRALTPDLGSPENAQRAENIRIHQQFTDTVSSLRNRLFPAGSTPPPEGVRREQIGSQDVITYTHDLALSANPPVQAYHSKDWVDHKDDLFFFRSGSRTFFAITPPVPEDGPQIPEFISMRIEDHDQQDQTVSRTEISSFSSGSALIVEKDGQALPHEQAVHTATSIMSEVSSFHFTPTTLEEVAAKIDVRKVLDEILHTPRSS